MSSYSGESETGLFIPTGGVKGGSTLRQTVTPTPLAAPTSNVKLDFNSGINSILAAANPVLLSIPPLRGMINHPDPVGLRNEQLQQIQEVTHRLRTNGVADAWIAVISYSLCTFVDETVAATPWGWSPESAKYSLLVTLHHENTGGERFFNFLAEAQQDPRRYVDLLEFFYVCLSLGFEGRYRVIEGGRAQLEKIRFELAEMIHMQRGEYERDLSPHWRGEKTVLEADNAPLILWVLLVISMFVMLVVFSGALFKLNTEVDEIPLAKILLPKPEQPEVRTLALPPPRLAQLLRNEIDKGFVQVTPDPAGELVRIKGDGLFESGKTSIKAAHLPMLEVIAKAINEVPGEVVIVGHTDDVASRSLEFPSNWHLSEGRANTVLSLIQPFLAEDRMVHAEGRGDTEPVAANDSPENRALNRRVEILVKN